MTLLVLTCPACASDGSEIVADDSPTARDRFCQFSRAKYGGFMDDWLSEITLRIRRCKTCGHCWYEQQPEDDQLLKMYAAGRPLGKAAKPSRQPTVEMTRKMRRLRALVDRSRSREDTVPRLLDYGSGFGRWARAAAAVGFEVTAFEPSIPRGSEDDARESGFRVVHTIDALDGGRFDAVNLEQVLEHIQHPAEALRRLRKYCHEHTILRITVPNILRAPERGALWETWPFNGEKPHTLAPFEHLHGFTPRSLRVLVERSGFMQVPLPMLLSGHAELTVRQFFGALIPRLGKTMVLIRPLGQ